MLDYGDRQFRYLILLPWYVVALDNHIIEGKEELMFALIASSNAFTTFAHSPCRSFIFTFSFLLENKMASWWKS